MRTRLHTGRARTDSVSSSELPERPRVLLVEDDLAVAESTRRLLELEGFFVHCAADGREGLDLALEQRYAAVLLDRRLPELSGDQVLHQLRQNGNRTPVLILTGFPDVDSAFQAGRLQANAYLTKSTTTGAALVAAIRAAIPAGEPSQRTSRLFSAYGGMSSVSFRKLVAYVHGGYVTSADLIRTLARVLSTRELTFLEFMATTKSFYLLHRKAELPLEALLSTVRETVDLDLTTRRFDPRLDDILLKLEEAGRDWSKVSAADICRGSRKRTKERAQLLGEPLEATFHQCRKAVVMRRAVLQLIVPHEQVRQVAYRLGYTDHGNFDHDFCRFFCVTPRQFRRLQ